MADASFEDGAERPLYLQAFDSDGLQVVATLTQDAVFPASEMTYRRKARQFVLLLNRFRWEDKANAEQRGRPYERVQSLLVVSDVMKVGTQGLDAREKDTVLSLLGLQFNASADGAGQLILTLAGDGAIALDVECLDVTLKDVTRPYIAPSGKAPSHPEP